ncbi:sensor histidine kinase [Desulfomonile tiedjei]|uniref:histidine kinase n=1 Tax=Desulfomonile tiedjei (strain ATCC 49306 / DSM 6799 / DCB-1) TaxID=706587 RepID=I4C1Y2_DESTA|nr:ATP-binding protein [Desulfomonile tiedjei]AFM23573.1 PAS domain S-box [Desulfomonile tiedjei DSM 6799]
MSKPVHDNNVAWPWLSLFIGICLGLVIGGYKYYQFEAGRISEEKYERLAAIGELKANQIQKWREENLRDIVAFAKAPFFRRELQKWLGNRSDIVIEKELQQYFLVQKENYNYTDILLTDSDGRFLLSANNRSDALSPTEESIIKTVLGKRIALIGDLYRSQQGIPELDVAVPIFDENRRAIAVLVGKINAEDLLYPLIEFWPTSSKTAETLLVRKDGEEVLFLNKLRHLPHSALSFRQPLNSSDLPAARAISGEKGVFRGKDYRGIDVLADLRSIVDSSWFMVAKVDASEIFAEIRYRGAVVFSFAILSILLTASAIAYGYRHRQATLYRNLYQLEQKQRETQEQFRTILYSIGDAVITTDTNGLVQQMNPVAERLTGWSEQEAKGQAIETVFNIVNESTREPVENPQKKVFRDGVISGLANHALLIARNGAEYPIADNAAPVRNEKGEIMGVVLVFRDQIEERKTAKQLMEAHANMETKVFNRTAQLSVANEKLMLEIEQRKLAEASVAKERQRFFDVMETLPVYIVLLTSDYHVLFENRVFRERFGQSNGKRCFEFLFNRTEPCENCETYGVLKTNESHHWEWTGPDGRDYDIYDFPFVDSDGSSLILEMGIDITERKQAEDALKQTLLDLTRSNSDLEHFAYVASHDLQEPLRTVTTALQIFEKKHRGKFDEDSDQLVDFAVEGAKKMRALIQDLLAYSRLNTRGKPFGAVDMQEILDQCLFSLKTLIEEKGSEVTSDHMPTILGDAVQLFQLFQNLIGNAIKFGPAKSPKVHVSAQQIGNEWIFSVKDNGIGIEEKYFDRIFVIFQQLSKKGPFHGTGMGLAIVKKIIERHHGRIWVESEVGVGSTFCFALPIDTNTSLHSKLDENPL